MLNDQERITNMLTSIGKIKQVTDGKEKEMFLQSWEMQDLCSFHLSLIGEDAKRLSDSIKATHPEIPWKAIASMRNVIVHDYMQTDYNIIWQSIVRDLPVLEKALNEMKS